MNDKKEMHSATTVDKKVLSNWVQKNSKTGKMIQKLQEEEFLILTDENWFFTWETWKRSLSHKEWLPHYSVHIWVVNTKKYTDDIGIYIAKKAKKKSWWYYQFRTAGWHVGVTSDWKMNWEEEDIRKQILEETAIREVMEELWLKLKKNWEIVDKETWEILEENSKFRVLIDKIRYQAVKEEFKDWRQVVEKNNEHIWIYAFEFSWEITNFEEDEIEAIEILSSKELIEKLEWDGSFFWHKDPKTWKQSNKYKTAIKIIKQLQKEYWIY